MAIMGTVLIGVSSGLFWSWGFLVLAFGLAAVSLVREGGVQRIGIAALVVAIVGGLIAFMVSTDGAGRATHNGADAVATQAAGQTNAARTRGATPTHEPDKGEEDSQAGTRSTPWPIGTTIRQGDWELTVNSVLLDGTDAVLAENQYNESPVDGHQYILVNVGVTYVGADTHGAPPAVRIDYVTPSGETVDLDTFAIAPNALDTVNMLYNGGATQGNVVISAPSEEIEDGVISVASSTSSEVAFFSVN